MNKSLVCVIAVALLSGTAGAEESEGSFFNMQSTDEGSVADTIYGDTTFGFAENKPVEEAPAEIQKRERTRNYQRELTHRKNIEDIRRQQNAEKTEQYFIQNVLATHGNMSQEQRNALQAELKQSHDRVNEYINSENRAREALDDIRRAAMQPQPERPEDGELPPPPPEEDFSNQYGGDYSEAETNDGAGFFQTH